jgi:hypothetical protein
MPGTLSVCIFLEHSIESALVKLTIPKLPVLLPCLLNLMLSKVIANSGWDIRLVCVLWDAYSGIVTAAQRQSKIRYPNSIKFVEMSHGQIK